MIHSKRIQRAAIGVALTLVVGLSMGNALAREKYEEKFAKSEALARDGRVAISNVSGSIVVKSWPKDEVSIEATKVAQASSLERAKDNAAQVKIEVTKSGNIVQIETRYPERSRNLNVSVSYVLTIPAGASLKVRNTSGSVEASDIGGSVEGNVTSGSLTLARIGGGVDAKVISGKFRMQDIVGDIDATSVSGGIEAVNVKGSVNTEATSGNITLRDVTGAKSVRAHVTSGRVVYDGEVLAGGKYYFEAFSGGVELLLPASAGFDLEAEAFSGRVNSDFPITMSGTISSKALRGVVNNGGAAMRVKTFSGSIYIRKK